MIMSLAKKLVDLFLVGSEIAEEERELFAYGIFILISKINYFVITVLFGCIFDVVVESVVFYFLFTLLRGYAGGIHAPSETICMISTTLSMFASVFLIWAGSKFSQIMPYACMLIINSIIIVILSPQESKQKPLEKAEKKLYKRKATIIVSLVLFISGIALSIHLHRLFLCCSVSIALEGILVLLGRISTNKKGGIENVKN